MTYRAEGLIYYALDANRHAQYLKIGYSSSLAKRIKDLRYITTSHQAPLILALEEGGIAEEKARHARFDRLRTHGEWFKYEGELVSFVGSLEQPFGYLLDRPHLWRFADGWGPLSSSYAAQLPKPRKAAPTKSYSIESMPLVRFPLNPGHSISAEGIEVGPDGLPPIDF